MTVATPTSDPSLSGQPASDQPASDRVAPSPGATNDKPRARNRRGQGDRLRQDLIDEAARQLAEQGNVDAVSLRKVASAVGVSPTSVYRHFEDHTALLVAAVGHIWDVFATTMATAQREGDSPYKRLWDSGTTYIRFANEEPGMYRVLFSDAIDLPGANPATLVTEPGGPTTEVEVYSQTAFGMLVGLVGEVLTDQGDKRDPFYVAVQVHTWLHGIVDLHHCHGEFPWPPMETLLEDVTRAIGLVDPAK